MPKPLTDVQLAAQVDGYGVAPQTLGELLDKRLTLLMFLRIFGRGAPSDIVWAHRGTHTGDHRVPRERSVELPEAFEPATTVLVARSVDAGWIPTVAQAAAVVVEIGGDLSDGSILLRERGCRPQVLGVTRTGETGEMLEVRAGARVMERRVPERMLR